jgi:23S rRNA (pseudouridine1915-N3)-methyltransferase
MAVKLVVVAAGKLRGPERDLCDDYLGRLKRYGGCNEREVKEASDLARSIPKGAVVIALEPGGEALTSTQLAKRIERWASKGKGVVAFIIGGATGIPADLVATADARLSLSTLTLPHRLARVVLAEQLYRAMTILRGEPYARE